MEVTITGTDLSEKPNAISAEPVILDQQSASLKIRGWNALEEEVDLQNAEISVTSADPEIISVDENNVLHAKGQGRTQIQVQVSLDGVTLSTSLYPGGNAEGSLVFGDYLSSVRLIRQNSPSPAL